MVTGASGFLGSEIVRLSRAAGWRVRAFVRCPRLQVEGAEMFRGDITDPMTLRKACKGASAVVHAAGLAHVFGSGAKDHARFNAVNEVGTGNVVDAAWSKGFRRLS